MSTSEDTKQFVARLRQRQASLTHGPLPAVAMPAEPLRPTAIHVAGTASESSLSILRTLARHAVSAIDLHRPQQQALSRAEAIDTAFQAFLEQNRHHAPRAFGSGVVAATSVIGAAGLLAAGAPVAATMAATGVAYVAFGKALYHSIQARRDLQEEMAEHLQNPHAPRSGLAGVFDRAIAAARDAMDRFANDAPDASQSPRDRQR